VGNVAHGACDALISKEGVRMAENHDRL